MLYHKAMQYVFPATQEFIDFISGYEDYKEKMMRNNNGIVEYFIEFKKGNGYLIIFEGEYVAKDFNDKIYIFPKDVWEEKREE